MRVPDIDVEGHCRRPSCPGWDAGGLAGDTFNIKSPGPLQPSESGRPEGAWESGFNRGPADSCTDESQGETTLGEQGRSVSVLTLNRGGGGQEAALGGTRKTGMKSDRDRVCKEDARKLSPHCPEPSGTALSSNGQWGRNLCPTGDIFGCDKAGVLPASSG